MARVLLAKARFTEYDIDAVTPPLGVMYVGAALREAGHQVARYEAGDLFNPDHFRAQLSTFRPDVVGLSAITFEGRVMLDMAATVRTALPGVPVVAGGPHPTAYPERTARHPAIDYVVLGEGEQTAIELLAALARGERAPRDVPGLVFEDASGELVWTGAREAIDDVDALPFPAWDLLDLGFYARRRSMSGMGKRPYMSVFTSRGCPFKCTYCHEVQGKRFRARSAGNVLRELTTLRDRFGIRSFEIVDDIFNFNKGRTIEILDRIIASDLDAMLHFPNALRTDLLDQDQILRLKRAGTYSLCVAVETTSERLQRLSKKYLKVDKVSENIGHAVSAGLYVRGFFMLGFPTETYEEARGTVDFAVRSRLHEAFFNIVTPFAGTTLFEVYQDMMRERGQDVCGFDDMSYMKVNINLSEMSDDQLFSLQRAAYRRFYVRPSRAMRIAWRHPSVAQLVQGGIRAIHYSIPKLTRGHAERNPIRRHFDESGLPTAPIAPDARGRLPIMQSSRRASA